MDILNFDKIQAEIVKPQRLCLHCGHCMPILDGENTTNKNIDPNSIRGPLCVWDEFPPECGYTGWLFFEREKQKHLVRKAKEEILALSFLDKNVLISKDKTAGEKIEELNSQIEPWQKYGADNW